MKKYLSCYVVCAGVCYGNGEQTLHSFFKQAWLGEQSLPIYGTAHNGSSPRAPRTISIIFFSYPSHPCQRSCISCSSCLGFKTKNSLYSCRRPRVSTTGTLSHINESFLRQSSLREIMKAISINLTTGKLHALGKDEAQASNDVSQIVLDCLSCNIRMEGVLVREELNFKWHSEG